MFVGESETTTAVALHHVIRNFIRVFMDALVRVALAVLHKTVQMSFFCEEEKKYTLNLIEVAGLTLDATHLRRMTVF